MPKNFPQHLKFEMVLYKNGKIQFRYPKRPTNFNNPDNRQFNNGFVVANLDATNEEVAYKGQVGASVGIFANWQEERYRDFSHILKYQKDNRSMFINGGAVKTAGYTDSGLGGIDQAVDDNPYGVPSVTASYNCNLNFLEHWPAPLESGVTFNFIPPMLKKKVNRRDIDQKATNSVIGEKIRHFDDERTVAFMTSSMSYPAGLPTSFISSARYRGISQTKNLHSSGSISVTRLLKNSIIDSSLDIVERKLENFDSFNESARFDMNNLNNSFFAFGSDISVGDDVFSFSKSLHTKQQFHVSFRVKNSTRMLGDKCSMYYFNNKNGSWSIPQGSTGDIKSAMENTSVNTNIMATAGGQEPYAGATNTLGSYFVHESIGFDCYGNSLISGSLNVFRTVTNSSFEAGTAYKRGNHTFNEAGYKFGKTPENSAELLMSDYPKSVQRNESYNASKDEIFTLPIDQPFLIEKIVLDVPLKLGQNWFLDRTATIPISASYDGLQLNSSGGSGDPAEVQYLIDEGGPGITFSLFCQKPYKKGTKIRDLISKRTLTHSNDSLNLALRLNHTDNSAGTRVIDAYLQGIPEQNFPQYVTGSNNKFSGSINLQMIPTICNGIKTLDTYTFEKQAGSGVAWPSEKLKSWLRSNKTKLSTAYINSLDAFGRAMTGFSPSGGSIFGREYLTDNSVATDGLHTNNFYCAYDSKYNNEISTITTLTNTFNPTAAINMNVYDPTCLIAEKSSPYLIMPGEELVLAASKSRPALKTVKFNITSDVTDSTNTFAHGKGELIDYEYASNLPSASVDGHDVQFSTGIVNITIYGSYVKQNRELLNR